MLYDEGSRCAGWLGALSDAVRGKSGARRKLASACSWFLLSYTPGSTGFQWPAGRSCTLRHLTITSFYLYGLAQPCHERLEDHTTSSTMKISPSLKPPGRVALGVAPPQAHLLCLLFASSYVGSIYITQHFFLPRANRSPAPTPAQTPSGQNGTTGTGPPVPPVVADEMDAERDAGPKIGSRDHPTTIRMRMRAVGLATASNMLVVLAVVKVLAGCSWTAAVCDLDLG